MAKVSKERLERAIVVMAAIVAHHGVKYAPLLTKLEREYAERFHDPMAHARAILERYQSRSGQLGKTILLSHSRK